MEDLKSNKMFWVLVLVTVFNVGAFLVGKIVIDKAADRVIQKLQKEYSPSPYGPGLDPDKVDTNKITSEVVSPTKHYLKLKPQVSTGDIRPTAEAIATENLVESWRDGWEKSRE